LEILRKRAREEKSERSRWRKVVPAKDPVEIDAAKSSPN
jgi:hypothetical protein